MTRDLYLALLLVLASYGVLKIDRGLLPKICLAGAIALLIAAR